MADRQCFIQGDICFIKMFDRPLDKNVSIEELIRPARGIYRMVGEEDAGLGDSPERMVRRSREILPTQNGYFVLARGEKTGHSHRIAAENAEVRELLIQTEERPTNDLVLALWENAEVIHEEHPPLKLEPGTYTVRQQRDFDPYEFIRERRLRSVSRALFD